MEHITGQRVPAALAALELSRQADRLVIAAPGLLAVDTVEAHFDRSNEITAEVERLLSMLEALRAQVHDPAALDDLRTGVDWLSLTVINLATLVGTRITITERIDELKAEIRQQLSEVSEQLDAEMGAVRRRFTGGKPSTRALQALETSGALERLRLRLGSLVDLLGITVSAKQESDLSALRARTEAIVEQVVHDLQILDPAWRITVADAASKMRRELAEESGLIDLRQRELAVAADGARLLQESGSASRRVTAAVDQLVQDANRGIRDSSVRAQDVQRTSTWLLGTAVGLGVLCSVLIVWLYVGRSIVGRLTQLSDSMLALAAGDLTAPLPAAGPGDEIGRMAEALRVFRDTALEMEEANLREIEEARRRLTHAIETINEGFALFDRDDRLVLCNRKFRESLYPGLLDLVESGTTFEDIARASAERGLVIDSQEREEEWVRERMELHRNPGQPHLQQGRDGRWIRVSERRTDDGGTVAVYTDITELKQREEEAATATEAKSQFLANMSHELRTPLNAVIGITELLEEDAQRQDLPEFAEPLMRIHRAGNHLLHLINEILDLSKIEAGRLEMRPEQIDFEALLSESIATARPLAEQNANCLELRDCSRIGNIWADPTRLRQITLNLLSNACKFTERGLITVCAQREELNGQDWLELRVQDTGIGMTPEEVTRLFNDFTQVDSSASRRHGGTGLGLAICRRLCELLGGSIEVDSEPGVGSTFTVRLPLVGRPSAVGVGAN